MNFMNDDDETDELPSNDEGPPMARPRGRPSKPYGRFAIKSAGLYLGSNPTQLSTTLNEDGVDEHRKIRCRRYDNCVTYAASMVWNSFSCCACPINDLIDLPPIIRNGEQHEP